MITLIYLAFALLAPLIPLSASSALLRQPLTARQAAPQGTPTFPADIPSCSICAQNYQNIDSCAQAAPVLANFTQVSRYLHHSLILLVLDKMLIILILDIRRSSSTQAHSFPSSSAHVRTPSSPRTRSASTASRRPTKLRSSFPQRIALPRCHQLSLAYGTFAQLRAP